MINRHMFKVLYLVLKILEQIIIALMAIALDTRVSVARDRSNDASKLLDQAFATMQTAALSVNETLESLLK